jgi:hypothetical protein
MKNSVPIPIWTKEFFKKAVLERLANPQPLYVYNNNVNSILEYTDEAVEEVNTHDVCYQPNTHFFDKLEITEITPYDFYKKKFKAYRDFYDKFNERQLFGGIVPVYNYSKDQDKYLHPDYPTEIKMILVVANFNFYDLNSQYYFARLSEDHKNILVIGQIRDDFDFAKNHINAELRTGINGGVFCRIE